MKGYVKLYRQLRENKIYKNSKAVHCWVECLLRANHAGSGYFLGRKKIELKPGQFIFGRDEFGQSIGMSGSTAWFWLLQFEVDSMVDIKKTSKGSLLTVLKWDEFQSVDSTLDNKKTIKKQQKNTDKNDKNEKKYIDVKFFPPSLLEVTNYFKEKGYSETTGEKAWNYYEVNKWKDGRDKPIKNWKQKMIGVWFKEENKIKSGYNC
jgi:hypothetical protein